MSKIYLCGITSESEAQNIEELTNPIWEHIDGLIFVYDGEENTFFSPNKCYNTLYSRKKEGKIICRPFTKDHDIQMSEFLRRGPLKTGDWFIIRDSSERFNPKWAKNIRSFLSSCELSGIRSLYNYGKGFAFKYNDSMIFQGSPHWGLIGAQPKSIDLSTMFDENKKEHTWRNKDGEPGGRPFDNKINHEAKYMWCYGRSNHLLLGYEDRLEEYQRAEMIRLHIREIARTNGFDLTIEGLKEFMIWLKEKDLTFFKNWVNSHRVVSNFYRYRILNEDFYEIEKTENTWKLV